MPVSVAARILTRSSIESFAIASRSPDNTVLNGSTSRELRLRLHHRRDPVQAVDHLRIHRMLDPQRAVLVEGGDARLAAARTWARLVRRGLHEFDDRLSWPARHSMKAAGLSERARPVAEGGTRAG